MKIITVKSKIKVTRPTRGMSGTAKTRGMQELNIEDKILGKVRLDRDKLISYGFTPEGDELIFGKVIFDENMRAELTVDQALKLRGKVIDKDTDEEYVALNIPSFTGSYVGEIRQAYEDLIMDVADKCGSPVTFMWEQTTRIATYIFERYHESPDNPFSTTGDYMVFRYPQTGKWYALVGNVKASALSRNKKDEDLIEIMNLKVEKDRMEDLLAIDGIYPAYHMSHKSWITILMNGSVEDEFIMELISRSREFAKGKGRGNSRKSK